MLDGSQITMSVPLKTAVIRMTIPRDQIQQVMGPAIGEVMGVVAAQGIGPAGPVFSHHFRMDPATFDFEVGVPVTKPVTPTGRVQPSDLPEARVARTVYRGPYEGLGGAWGEFCAWIASQGHKSAGNLWEFYGMGPESGPDPTQWETELNCPLAG